MTPLSPLDTLGPAFRRMREVLAQPFRLGFFLKIALVAALTQASFYSATFSYPIQGVQVAFAGKMPGRGHYEMPFQSGAAFATVGFAVLLVIALGGIAVWVLMSYLYCRLRFTLFDLVVYKRGLVGEAWRKYGRQTWRYFGLTILASLAFLVVALVVAGPAILHLFHAMRGVNPANAAVNPFPVLGAMLPFLGAIFFVALLWGIVDALIQDFLLPPMALEDAPLENAFARLGALLRENFGPVALYLLLRFAVGIGITTVLFMALFMVLLILGVGIFALGMVLYHLLWTSLAGQVAFVAMALVVGLIVLAIYLIGIISIYGIAAVFKQSYAVFFFGGRYPQLGNALLSQPKSAAVVLYEPPPQLPPIGDAPPVW